MNEDNVWFDFAALPYNMPEEYPFPSSIAIVEKALSIVGEDKLIWGSDCPFVLCHFSYDNLLNYITKSTNIDERQLEKMMSLNAMEAYRLDL